MLKIYKITTAPASSTSSITMKTKELSAKSYSVESTLSIAEDDYGNSYYYRGGVKDNYIEFNNMCWRVVRIEGDGSIKIILAKEGLCSTISSSDTTSALINNGAQIVYGYKSGEYGTLADYENYNGGLYTTLKTWYTSSGLENKKSLLKNEKWCLGGSDSYRYNYSTGALLTDTSNTSYYYAAGKRLRGIGVEKNATLKCSSEEDSVSDYIGTITADEAAYAGGVEYDIGNLYYIFDNAQSNYWTLSRSCFDLVGDDIYILDFYYDFNANGSMPDNSFGVRPAVTLATGTQIMSGDGTIRNPYKILEN